MSRRFQIGAGLVALAAGMVWLAWALWPRPSAEDQIKRVFATVADALADGRFRPIADAIDDAYSDSIGDTKRDILDLLRALTPLNPEAYHIEYDSIRVIFSDDETARADIAAKLVIKTRKTDATIQSIPGTVTVHLHFSRGRWRIIRAEGWQTVAERAGAGRFGPN